MSPPVGGRPRVLPALSLAVYFVGVVLKALYVFVWHPMKAHIYSDMELYFRLAKTWMDKSHVYTIEDSLYPPGTSLLFGWLWRVDPSLRLASCVQLGMALLVPWLLYRIARDLYPRDERLAWLVLLVSSVHLPLFEYAGFFMSENPFIFFLLLAFALLVRSLRSAARWPFVALAAGVALGLAVSFKSAALLSAVLVVGVILLSAKLTGLRPWKELAAAALGLSLVLVPLSVRATRLNEGRFALVANDAARGLLIGHHGDVFIVHFDDVKRGYSYVFGCATHKERGRTATHRVPYGPWDTKELTHEAWVWTKEHPKESFLLGLEHVYDLFIAMPWPSGDNPMLRRFDFAFQRAYQPLVLFPAGIGLVVAALGLWRKKEEALSDLMLIAPLVSIMASAFLSVGESRYRAPFDGFLILLALRGYLTVWDLLRARRTRRETALVPDA